MFILAKTKQDTTIYVEKYFSDHFIFTNEDINQLKELLDLLADSINNSIGKELGQTFLFSIDNLDKKYAMMQFLNRFSELNLTKKTDSLRNFLSQFEINLDDLIDKYGEKLVHFAFLPEAIFCQTPQILERYVKSFSVSYNLNKQNKIFENNSELIYKVKLSKIKNNIMEKAVLIEFTEKEFLNKFQDLSQGKLELNKVYQTIDDENNACIIQITDFYFSLPRNSIYNVMNINISESNKEATENYLRTEFEKAGGNPHLFMQKISEQFGDNAEEHSDSLTDRADSNLIPALLSRNGVLFEDNKAYCLKKNTQVSNDYHIQQSREENLLEHQYGPHFALCVCYLLYK